jgi:hypothetical protein
VAVYNVDKRLDLIKRERRRRFNDFARAHLIRAAHCETGPVGMSCAGVCASGEVSRQPRVRERVAHLMHIGVTLIGQCVLDPLEEVWWQ